MEDVKNEVSAIVLLLLLLQKGFAYYFGLLGQI